jgi:hypothetical protein
MIDMLGFGCYSAAAPLAQLGDGPLEIPIAARYRLADAA